METVTIILWWSERYWVPVFHDEGVNEGDEEV